MNRQDKRAGLQETHDKNGKALTKYDPNMALAIIERIAAGELLRDITNKRSDPPTVSRATFLKWVSTVPELGAAYKLAMEMSAHALEEEAIAEARERRDSPGNAPKVSASSNLIKQLQWSAERRDPGRYGQKNNAALIIPVTINSTLDLGDEKKAVSEAPDFYKLSLPVEDAEFTEVKDEKENEGLTVLNPEEFENPSAAPDFKDMLRVDEPVVGTNRQPLLHRERKQMSRHKRQLTPRTPGYKSGAEQAREITEREQREKANGIPKSADAPDGERQQSDASSTNEEH